MNKSFKNRLVVYLLGCAVIGCLIYLSDWFWMERTLYIDMAFHTFVIAQSKSFAIQNNRFGAAITQIFPLLAVKAQLPLKQVLQLYSCSFYICYFLYFTVIVQVLKKETMGIVLLLSLTLLTSCSFFWAQTEFPQSLSFLILFLSIVISFYAVGKMSLSKGIFLLSMLITVVFFHPLIIIPLVFSLIYFRLNKNIDNRKTATLLVAIVLIAILKSVLFPTGAYESGKMSGMHNFLSFFPHYLTLKSNQFFIQELTGNYAAFTFLFLVAGGFYLSRKYYLKLSWLLLAVISYTLLINISFPDLAEGTYLQNMHLALAVFVALPFAFEIVPLLKIKYWLPILLLIFIFRLAAIYKSNTPFSGRLDYLKKLVAYSRNYPGKKFRISDENISAAKYFDTWGLPYETLILSSIPSPDSARTIALESNVKQNESLAESEFSFINPYGDSRVENLPNEYFRLQNSKYLKIDSDISLL